MFDGLSSADCSLTKGEDKRKCQLKQGENREQQHTTY